MASILRVDTLTDASSNNSTAISTINQGTAKAWINFNGTGTPSVTKSYNTGSITDNGTGQYHITITNALSDANFVALGSVIGDSATSDRTNALVASRDSKTTTRIPINTINVANAGAQADWTHISAAVLGDLA